MLIGAPGVSHVFEHDLADLERPLSEPNLQDFNIAPLKGREHLHVVKGCATCLFIVVAVCDRKEARGKQDLQLLHKQVLGVVDADQCADDIARLVRSEI